MEKEFFFIWILFFSNFVCANAQVVINEIQYSPVNGEPEWIELYNYSAERVTLQKAMLEDAVGSKVLPAFDILGNQYAVITKDTLSLKSRRILPESAVLIEAEIPIFNNDWDVVVLRGSNSLIIDSVYYKDKWGKRGFSFERIDWSKPANTSENLAASISKDSATAGYENSIARKEYDAIIFSDSLQQGLTDSISFIIKNSGRNKIEKLTFNIFIDINRNDDFEDDEKYVSKDIFHIEPDAYIIISFNSVSLSEFISESGKFRYRAYCDYPSDEKRWNDTLYSELYIPYKRNTVLINEFMYDVSPQMAEFVELWNTSGETVSLEGWYIHDRAADEQEEYFRIATDKFIIEPHSYCVIGWDSLLFFKFPELMGASNVYVRSSSLNLNLAGDDIVIRDPLNNVMDSIYYLDSWHNPSLIKTKDISLEKINMNLTSMNAAGWTSCRDERGATPGRQNSTYYSINQISKVTAEPNPFSPYSNGKDNLCIISFNFEFRQSLLSATIYDVHGFMVRKLISAELIFSKGMIVWDGKNDDGFILPVGPYILFLEAADTSSDRIVEEKLLIVIGR